MSRKVSADFYKVEKVSTDQPNFETALSEIREIPHNSSSRNILHFGNHVRLDSISESDSHLDWIGDIVKIRMDNIPPKASLVGDLTPLQLATNEGLGEETAFLYIPNHEVLIIQKNHFGVYPSLLCRYIYEITPSKASYRLKPILTLAAFDRLNRMRSVRKMQISFANITNAKTLVSEDDGIKSTLSKFEDYGAINADIILSIGRSKRRTLSIQNICDTVRRFVAINENEDVKKIEIAGKDEHDSSTVLDLLDDKITYDDRLESDAYRNIARSTRYTFLREAWDTKREEILNLFSTD